MNETPKGTDPGPLPEDIATLYSQAQRQGTRYWDFSASRKEVQGQFRLRIAREHAKRAGVEAVPPLPMREFGEEYSEPWVPLDVAAEADTYQTPVGEPAPQGFRQFQAPAPGDFESAGGEALRSPTIHLSSPAQTEERTEEIVTNGRPVVVPRREVPAPDTSKSDSTKWYALHSVLEPPPAPADWQGGRRLAAEKRPPVLAVFSLAGGVGKTCLVATLGRALSALGEQVLLAETTAGGVLPFYFGSREVRPGIVRTFIPPIASFPAIGMEKDAPVQLLSLHAEQRFPQFDNGHDPLVDEVVHDGRGSSRILIDVDTANRAVAARLLALRPMALVPILPDINSVSSLHTVERLLGNASSAYYVLNQFDETSALHRDVREMMQERLGDRLLPITLRRSAAVSEALAEGMTVIDYAPDSDASEDYRQLAGWARKAATAATAVEGGHRWSER